MPTITLENDPTTFTVTTRDGKPLNIDVLELASALMGKGIKTDATPADADLRTPMIESVRSVAFPKDSLAGVTDDQLFALGSKVMLEYKRLGK